MVDITKIAAIYADAGHYSGMTVTVGGWAKTIRDLKTFGFIELNDGSCFKNLQVVMSAEELSNYKEIAAQNVGASLIVRGTVVLTPDAKQPLEVKAPLSRWRASPPRITPCRRSATAWNSCAPSSTCGPAPICFRHVPRPLRGGLRRPRVLPEPGLRLCPDPHHHRLRLRGRGRDVPGHDARS